MRAEFDSWQSDNLDQALHGYGSLVLSVPVTIFPDVLRKGPI